MVPDLCDYESMSGGSPAKQKSISLVVADHTLTVASEPPLTAISCVSRRVSARSFTPPCSDGGQLAEVLCQHRRPPAAEAA